MALQEQTLTDTARAIREQARGLRIRSESIQTALFGSEPSAPTDMAKQAETTVEGLLREALAIMREAEERFARVIANITQSEIGAAAGYPAPSSGGYADDRRTHPVAANR